MSPENFENTKPVWKAESRELLFRGETVKRFRWPSKEQEIVLAAFQKLGWPERIDDPLPISEQQLLRLHDTAKCLNKNQENNVIRFRIDESGTKVRWEQI